MSMADSSLSRIASFLALAGGVLMVAFGVLALIESSLGGALTHWDFAYGGAVTLVCGIVALIGSKNVGVTIWAIMLIVVGAIGGGLGGLLVILGGILGLLAKP
jgi:hypothetical protein